MNYKKVNNPFGDGPQILARIDDDGLIRVTCTEKNPEYLEWVAKGNTADPAD